MVFATGVDILPADESADVGLISNDFTVMTHLRSDFVDSLSMTASEIFAPLLCFWLPQPNIAQRFARLVLVLSQRSHALPVLFQAVTAGARTAAGWERMTDSSRKTNPSGRRTLSVPMGTPGVLENSGVLPMGPERDFNLMRFGRFFLLFFSRHTRWCKRCS